MEVPFKAEFESQVRNFSFCYTCETCANFDEYLNICLHGFPNRLHKASYYEQRPAPPTIVFCKEFDLA